MFYIFLKFQYVIIQFIMHFSYFYSFENLSKFPKILSKILSWDVIPPNCPQCAVVGNIWVLGKKDYNIGGTELFGQPIWRGVFVLFALY